MTRDLAVASALACFDKGAILDVIRTRVAFHTESQAQGTQAELEAYLREAIEADVEKMGFSVQIVPNEQRDAGPFLLASRMEDEGLPTMLMYGHGDTTLGNPHLWRKGLAPWSVTVEGDRWYGRGTADNKGQHSINLAAIEQVLAARKGKLGFNIKLLIEMGEEMGSPGLRRLCDTHRKELSADVLIASDGPRVSAERPTLFLGGRGIINFDLHVDLRERGHHSGNWGGLLRNPGTVLASAIASIVDAQGRILVPALKPPPIPAQIRAVLSDLTVGGGPEDPPIDDNWGEPGLSAAERLYGWNALEVLTFKTGDPERPQNAIPPSASARLQLRFVVGTQVQGYLEELRAHLDAAGFPMVEVRATRGETMAATRLNPDEPWVQWAARSMERTTGKKPAILPNLGGSLPNEVFAHQLALPTLWVPHSYPACAQHSPDEHMLASIAREGLAIMTALLWDLGEDGAKLVSQARGKAAERSVAPAPSMA